MLARMLAEPLPDTADGKSNLPEVLDFLASIIASLAWPVVVLVLLLMFRSHITSVVTALRERMPDVERLKTPWGEMAWSSSAVKQVSEDVDEKFADMTPNDDGPQTKRQESVARELAAVEPSAGVIRAFLDVEQQAGRFLRATGQPFKGTPIVSFRQPGAAPPRLQRLVVELSDLRNAAAHGVGDVSLESALEYIESAERVAAEIQSIADRERNVSSPLL